DIDPPLRLTTHMRLGFEGGRATARTLVKEGETRFCALSWTEHPAPASFEEAYRRLVWTAHHWQHWLACGRFPDHPWRRYLQRRRARAAAPPRRARRRPGRAARGHAPRRVVRPGRRAPPGRPHRGGPRAAAAPRGGAGRAAHRGRLAQPWLPARPGGVPGGV